MDKIIHFLRKYNVRIIEDAAESFGGLYKDKPFGSFGDLSILSFYSNKIITTGEGGMILTNNHKLNQFAKSYRNLFFNSKRNFIHNKIGQNFRLTSLQASLGLSQVMKINKFINYRKQLFDLYLKKLDNNYVNFQTINQNIKKLSYWLAAITFKSKKHTASKIITKLRNHNIESRHFFYSLSSQPFLGNQSKFDNTNTMKIHKNGIYLPLGNGIKKNEVLRVIKTLNFILQNNP